MKISSALQRPYYFEKVFKRRLSRAFIFGGFVFLFLFLFKPFGLFTLKSGILSVCLLYGGITTLSLIVLDALVLSIERVFGLSSRWNIMMEIITIMINIIVIGGINFLFSDYMGFADFSINNLTYFILLTLAVGIFPIAAFVFINETKLKQKSSKQAEGFNVQIDKVLHHSNEEINHSEKLITVNTNPQLQLKASDIIYLKASSNYVEIYYQQHKQLKRKVIRASLIEMENKLIDFGSFFRCHKSYLVNLMHILSFEGNAQGLKLRLNLAEDKIPVSRNLISDFKSILSRP